MDKQLGLANQLCDVVISNVSCLKNWGFYLFDKEFDREIELRNRVGTIWVCSLLDTLDAHKRHLPRLEAEADKFGWAALAHASRELSKFCLIVGNFIGRYTREEQIFLQDFRHQLVHSYLSGRHSAVRRVKYFKNGSLIEEQLNFAVYNSLVGEFYDMNPGLDATLVRLISKAIDRSDNHIYWRAIGVLQSNLDEICLALREGRFINIISE